MEVQWQLVDTKTGNGIKVGPKFEVVDFMAQEFDGEHSMSWHEACAFFGDLSRVYKQKPTGILGCSPIEYARDTIRAARQKRP